MTTGMILTHNNTHSLITYKSLSVTVNA